MPDRSRRYLLLVILMLVYTLAAWHGAVHLDLTRDTRTALDIRDGVAYPLLGPLMAGQVHLGSGWYYLLALLHSMGDGWLGSMLGLTLLASLQFPLAYLAGKAWLNRQAGLTWAALLLLPSWSTFEQVFPTHTQLTAALTLATLCCVWRHVRTGKNKYLLASALLFPLALHAHPTTLILTFPILVATIIAWRRGAFKPATFAWMTILALLPFSPLLLDQWLHGFSILNTVGHYADSEQAQVVLGNLPALLWQIVAGGSQYWLSAMLAVDAAVADLIALLLAGVMLLGLTPLALRALRGDPTPILVIATLALGLLMLVAIRKYYPYYMTTAYRVLLLGGVSSGLTLWVADKRWARALPSVLAVICTAGYLAVWSNIAGWQRNGDWPLAILPLFDVKSDRYPGSRLAMMSTRAMAHSGTWLCQQERPALHGAYGVHLIHDYALETRLDCPGQPVHVGGSEPDHSHWLGLSRAMARRLGVGGVTDIGGFSLIPATVLPQPAARAIDPRQGGYPPVRVTAAPERQWQIELSPNGRQHLAITNLAFVFAPFPQVRVWNGERELQPVDADWTTRAYSCEACAAQAWRVEFRTANPAFVDVVSF